MLFPRRFGWLSRNIGTPLFLALGKPIIRFFLFQFKRAVSEGLLPKDEPDTVILGADPDRLLFIGDLAVSGFGLHTHGLSAATRIAKLVANRRGRGSSWSVSTAVILTSAEAAAATYDHDDLDVVVVMLGVPDVLLFTSQANWTANLTTIVDTIRARSGYRCQVVFAAIPPMTEITDTQFIGRQLMKKQIRLLNAATRKLATELDGATFVTFPPLRMSELEVDGSISFRALHEIWAQSVAPAVDLACQGSSKHRSGRLEQVSRPLFERVAPVPQKAEKPVTARPTRRAFTSYVPSYE